MELLYAEDIKSRVDTYVWEWTARERVVDTFDPSIRKTDTVALNHVQYVFEAMANVAQSLRARVPN